MVEFGGQMNLSPYLPVGETLNDIFYVQNRLRSWLKAPWAHAYLPFCTWSSVRGGSCFCLLGRPSKREFRKHILAKLRRYHGHGDVGISFGGLQPVCTVTQTFWHFLDSVQTCIWACVWYFLTLSGSGWGFQRPSMVSMVRVRNMPHLWFINSSPNSPISKDGNGVAGQHPLSFPPHFLTLRWVHHFSILSLPYFFLVTPFPILVALPSLFVLLHPLITVSSYSGKPNHPPLLFVSSLFLFFLFLISVSSFTKQSSPPPLVSSPPGGLGHNYDYFGAVFTPFTSVIANHFFTLMFSSSLYQYGDIVAVQGWHIDDENVTSSPYMAKTQRESNPRTFICKTRRYDHIAKIWAQLDGQRPRGERTRIQRTVKMDPHMRVPTNSSKKRIQNIIHWPTLVPLDFPSMQGGWMMF